MRRRRAAGLALALGALVAAGALSVLVGSKMLAPHDIVHALTAYTGTPADQIVLELRVSRTIVAVIVGAALGVAGALIQALTRNPLGDPGILGVDAGAAFFVAVAVGVVGVGTAAGYLWWAFGGALLATVVVYLVGVTGRRGVDPIRMTLAGVAVAAVLTGLTTTMMLIDPVAFTKLRGWDAGSLVERGPDIYVPVLPFVVVGLALALAVAHPLNALGLGEDLARSLGARVVRTRILTVVAITLLAGGATAIAGPIAFVGLMVPHVARWIVGPDQRWIVPYSLVLAPTLVLVSDVVGRVVISPSEVPVGIVTAFVGAPVLIALVRRSRVSAL
ncbi:iron chelate uptake ABC transporter family permease subunit [Herbiconiux sp. CPCC 205763]|uniref:Iron chelate uptake ABC transporter family permease subunit n=1 Tax=Herbiconiux aconitum TaxID=2970913 RepID=A0ABT2GVC4_9MICO|nr:iron chelate uptake ABC transporter family permease subunit [Herbiconiux aconitum]